MTYFIRGILFQLFTVAPAGQFGHSVLVPLLQKYPAGQDSQAVPSALLHVPLAQLEH